MKKKQFLTQSELRVDNVKQYMSDMYSKDAKQFYKDFKELIISKLKFSEEQAETKVKLLRQAMGQYKNRSFSKSLQNIVEKSFGLDVNILSQIRPKRSATYIFLSCTGKSANVLFTKLQQIDIIDEISVLYGDIDVFIKVYGTSEEIQELITVDLFGIKGLTINNTKTYFTLEGKSWTRYPISKHSKYKAPTNRWSFS